MFQDEILPLGGVIVASHRRGRIPGDGRHQIAALPSPEPVIAASAAVGRALDRAGDDQHRLAEAAVVLLLLDAPGLVLAAMLLAEQVRHGLTTPARNPDARRRRPSGSIPPGSARRCRDGAARA